MEERLFDLAHTLGVRVQYVNLPSDRDGEYEHGLRTIRLQHGLTSRLHRSVLAHECGHAVLAHVATACARKRAKHERQADEWAARFLIDPDVYRHAEIATGGHAGAMAVELGVVTDVVLTYRAVLARHAANAVGAPPGAGLFREGPVLATPVSPPRGTATVAA